MNLAWYAGLPAATWAVYLTDHLLDATNNANINSRHLLIARHRQLFILLISVLLLFCSAMVWATSDISLFWAAALCVPFVVVYFLLTFYANKKYQWLFNKEMLVAFVYTLSIYAVVIINNYSTPGEYIFLLLVLFMISYINLLSVSIIEMKKDLAAQKFSWALVLGRKRAHVLLYVVFIATFIIYIIYRFNALTVETEPLMRIYMFMLLAHMVVYSNHEKLEKGEWYRKLSELIFWWPVLILLFYK